MGIFLTDAGIKVGEESSIALATEGATGVDTLRVHGTVVDAHGALIDICKEKKRQDSQPTLIIQSVLGSICSTED